MKISRSTVLQNSYTAVCVCVCYKYSIAQIGNEFPVLDVPDLGTASSILLYLPEEHPKMLQS